MIWLLCDLFPKYFSFYSSSNFYRGRITLWMNSFRSLLAIVSFPTRFFSSFELRMIR
jgi:hypothetical protein